MRLVKRVGFLMCLALVAALLVPAGVGAQGTQPPGPCDDGWVAPTPTVIAVTSVPITVSSTEDDYFVLYVKHDRGAGTVVNVPVLVKRGESGTTSLSDSLSPLGADKYRVEKYLVANPADVDGDCVDDITELDDFGYRNPTNPAMPVPEQRGAVALEDRAAFEKLSYKGDRVGDRWLRYIEFVKFNIANIDTERPKLWFQNTSTYRAHSSFLSAALQEVVNCCWSGAARGALIYYPNGVAPDGSLGVYRWEFQPYSSFAFREVAIVHETLATAMPFLKGKLAYYPFVGENAKNKYKQQKSLYDASRVNVLLESDIPLDAEYAAYNEAEGYGLLGVFEPGELPDSRDIAIVSVLPNDLPRAAGVITTVPQTPLSHVNLRAIQNGTPNAFMRDALIDSAVTDLLDSYVYYRTTANGFTLRAATKSEVYAHHEASRPQQTQTLQRDLSKTSITSLSSVSFADWTAFGVKAANVAELTKVSLPTGTAPVGYAVPFYFYDEFMKQATVSEETILGKKKAPDNEKITLPAGTTLASAVTQMLAHSKFQTDADIQEEMLDDLRKAIKNASSPAWIITALTTMHGNYPDGQSLRYRSSTNNEDLADFNGAGLYDSKTQDPDETVDDGIDKSIKAVWASLWNHRAFIERDFYRVDHTTVAMGVLVHPNYSDEKANGVAVSYDPVTDLDGYYYVNTQIGENLVTNPEANALPEKLLLDPAGAATVLARSNIGPRHNLLMTDAQMIQLRDSLKAIHDHFETLYNPGVGVGFAMEIEFKITAQNKLAIKQARPWVFSQPLSAEPDISIASDGDVTEGADATFTLTASPRPFASVDVTVAVTQSGDFVATGSETVTITPSGTATLKVPTTNDSSDEADGSVTATVNSGAGYTVYTSSGSATVAVSDDDPTPGVVPVSDCVSDKLLNTVRSYYDANRNNSPGYGKNWKRVLIAFGDVQDDHLTPFTAAEATQSEQRWFGWTPVRQALECIETSTQPDPTPEISIAAGSGVTEGSDATFTLTASPTPAAALTVNVTVSQSGDYGATTGAQTVTIPTGGSYTLTVATSDDSTDEADGSVTATLNTGTGYTVSSSSSSSTVAISDDDDPPPATPEISIVGGSGVTEGADATFTITASPTPAAALTVSVTVSQSGDYGATTGAQTVTIPTGGSYTLTVATSDDSNDEADGSVTATLNRGTGYTVSSSSGAATVAVADDDPTPGVVLVSDCVSDQLLNTVRSYYDANRNNPPIYGENWKRVLIAFGDVQDDQLTPFTAAEATQSEQRWSGWTPVRQALECIETSTQPDSTPEISIAAGSGVTEGSDASFTLTANPTPASALDVSLTVSQSGDYGATTGAQTVTIPTSGSYTLTVATSDDGANEADGSVTATLNIGNGYTVSTSNGAATVAVSDDDVPEVSIVGDGDITEGSDASFTLTANPVPYTDLSVSVSVTQSGDFDATTGVQTVTIPTGGSYTLTVATSDDSEDEADEADETDGSITATVNTGAGYTVSATDSAATVAVACDLPDDAITVAEVTDWRDEYSIATHQSRWNRVLEALGEDTSSGESPMTAAQALDIKSQFDNSRWDRTVRTLEAMEQCDNPASKPEISIVGGSGVTEGTDATFTITASPTPASALDVSLTVSQSGDYGATTGAQTITIPTGGSYTLTVATSDDSDDEADGSVTATLNSGTDYTVSSSNSSATVAISDDDGPLPATPEISIVGSSGITEGGTASFTITASPTPASALDVSLTVSQSGDFGATTGAQTVTIPTGGTYTLTVATSDDSDDETDGSVTATLNSGTGYTVSSGNGAAMVAVSDDDDPAPPADVSISIAGASGQEGISVLFEITLSQAVDHEVRVLWETGFDFDGDHIAIEGTEFWSMDRWVVFAPGETSQWAEVYLNDDQYAEPDETFLVELSDPEGGSIAQGIAIMTIIDDD